MKSISSKGETVQGELRRKLRYPPGDKDADPVTLIDTEVPTFANEEELASLLERNGVIVNAEPPEEKRSTFLTILLSFLPTLLLVGLFIFAIRRMSGGAGGAASFGRSRARRVEPTAQRLTFDDVAGIDEAKDEVMEIVEFLKNPKKFRRLGGRIPRGVLLVGEPGTGKTLLAQPSPARPTCRSSRSPRPSSSRCSSAWAPPASATCSSRPRTTAPAIIFIDEIDAIGRPGASAGSAAGTTSASRRSTRSSSRWTASTPTIEVIVLSATNRLDVLDPALIASGRFDRQIDVQLPDMDGRARS